MSVSWNKPGSVSGVHSDHQRLRTWCLASEDSQVPEGIVVLLIGRLRSTPRKMKTSVRHGMGGWCLASQHLGGWSRRIENYRPVWDPSED